MGDICLHKHRSGRCIVGPIRIYNVSRDGWRQNSTFRGLFMGAGKIDFVFTSTFSGSKLKLRKSRCDLVIFSSQIYINNKSL